MEERRMIGCRIFGIVAGKLVMLLFLATNAKDICRYAENSTT